MLGKGGWRKPGGMNFKDRVFSHIGAEEDPGVRNLAVIAQKQPTAGEEAFQHRHRPTYP